MTVDTKNSLREELKSISGSAVGSIEEKVLSWPVYQAAEKIGFYLAMDDEISVNFLFESEKEVFLPRFKDNKSGYEMAEVRSRNDLTAGKFGIQEPSSACRPAQKDEIDLWLIPGVAFDRKGNRLGRGAGFYDRILSNENGLKAGVCCAGRIIEEIPVEDHDIKMDFVLTDKEIIKIKTL